MVKSVRMCDGDRTTNAAPNGVDISLLNDKAPESVSFSGSFMQKAYTALDGPLTGKWCPALLHFAQFDQGGSLSPLKIYFGTLKGILL